ncbi:MAG: hypothetical protein PV340_00065 [Wolbachia sp.]|nr:hypothetical protein [Wolbachia sp.]MDD9336675.1 hypothetical protein [Wolbachia sp.]
MKTYSNVPISNSHLLSLFYHSSWKALNAVFLAIIDPIFASTISTAINERKCPEDKQWSEVLRNTVPN